MNVTNKQRAKRKIRIRSTVRGTKDKPRLSVFRSNNHIYAQIIDDTMGKTIVSISEKTLGEVVSGLKKTELAKLLGERIAKKAKDKKITAVVFDKGYYKYHGRIKALAIGAREGGLKF